MIDSKYLESGLRIKKESEQALFLINKEEKKLKDINEKLVKITEELEEMGKDIEKKYNSPEDAKVDIFKKLNDIEVQSARLNKALEPLNKKMESLRKEEDHLWNTVKERYPNMEEDDIVKEFQSYIKNKN
jgi:prefoldin subunit 5